jgi:outer membrane protein assembly factor BamB
MKNSKIKDLNINIFLRLFVFLFFINFISSCKKPTIDNKTPKVLIKNFQLLGFEDLTIETSLENINPSMQDEVGICWNDSGEPTVSDNLKIFTNNQLKDTIRTIGQNKKIFARAFYRNKFSKNESILYSTTIEVSTKGLKKLMEKEVMLDQFVNVVQVVNTNRNTFIVLYECLQKAPRSGSYPAIIEIDGNGQVLWKKEYITKDKIIAPLDILEIPSGYLVFCRYMDLKDEILILKIDKFGNKVFEKIIIDTERQRLKNVELLSDGTIKVIMSQFDTSLSDGTLINHKIVESILNENAEVLYQKYFDYETNNPAGNNDMNNLILHATNGNIFSANIFLNLKDFVISPKVLFQLHDKNHKLIWEKIMEEPINAIPLKISRAINGNPVVMNPRELQRRLWLTEVNLKDGSIRWEYNYSNFRFGPFSNTLPISLCTDREGSHYVTGDVTPKFGVQSNTFIVKVDKDGKKMWDFDFAEQSPYKFSKSQHILINNVGNIVLFRYKMQELSDYDVPLVITTYEEL